LASNDFFDDQSHFDNAVVAREDMRKDISKWVVSASGPKSNMTRVYEESQRILEKMDSKSATVSFGKIKDKDNEEIYIGRQFISKIYLLWNGNALLLRLITKPPRVIILI
jgi:hypothetical protein